MVKNMAPDTETPALDSNEDVLPDPFPEPSPEPSVESTPSVDARLDQPTTITPARRGGFVAPLLGGALAAGIGFGLAHFDALGLRGPTADGETAVALGRQATDLAALQANLTDLEATLSERVGKSEAALAALPAPTDFEPMVQRLTALEDRLTAIEALPASGGASSPAVQAAIRDLEARVAALGTTAALPDELTKKVDAALQQLAEAEADATASAAEAAGQAESARRDAVLNQLKGAVDQGEPYDGILTELAAEPMSEALTQHATTGVATLMALADSFPQAARAALLKARALSGADGWGARLADFLKAQTGARSLTAREGTDPDAILSRAEAAVREGRLADALTEIEALPPEVAAAMADWTRMARARVEVEAAVAALFSPSQVE